MSKPKRGQPPKPAHLKKSQRTTMRMTPSVQKMLIDRFGSVQVFFDLSVKNEIES